MDTKSAAVHYIPSVLEGDGGYKNKTKKKTTKKQHKPRKSQICCQGMAQEITHEADLPTCNA
ncbi:hypothetical protein CHS0354_022254, partial [Potamilus streckersoni]